MLFAENLTFGYSEPLGDSICFNIPHSKVGIVGRNGCGKTTLLRVLAGQHPPWSGTFRPSLGYLVDFDLTSFHRFYVSDIVTLCRALPGSFETSHSNEYMELLGLTECANTPIGQMSKGTAKKVALLIGLMETSGLLLLDEPFESLDEETNSYLVDVIRSSSRDVIVVSHDRSLLQRSVDIILTFKNRSLVESWSKSSVEG